MYISSNRALTFKSLRVPFLLLLLYVYFLASGVLGAGVDVCFGYSQYINSIWRPSEFVGGLLSTLSINGQYYGQFLISSLFVFSYYLFSRLVFVNFASSALITTKSIKILSNPYTCVLNTIVITFSWPLLNMTTNVLRQGSALLFAGFACYFVLL